MKGSFVNKLFEEEPAGAFAHGHIFINGPDMAGAQRDPGAGYWHCDIADNDRLTWSEKVYALFGLDVGTSVKREWAVSRYAEPSKSVLERVRSYALDRKLGFLLDAAISLEGEDHRWIRVLAVPILARGRVVGLHGLKRAL